MNQAIPQLFIPIDALSVQLGCSKQELRKLEREGQLPPPFNGLAYVLDEVKDYISKRNLVKSKAKTADELDTISGNIASFADARKNKKRGNHNG